MHCPGCGNELTAYNTGTVEVDICREHCGGIWFDAGEFEKYDEAAEDVPAMLLKVVQYANVAIDRNKKRPCPRCQGQSLEKRFFDDSREVQIDQCPECAGIWLDPGELDTIREENRGATARKGIIDDFFKRASGGTSEKHQKGMRAVLSLLFK